MKVCLLIFVAFLLASCGMYKYSYDTSKREIVSETETYITQIVINTNGSTQYGIYAQRADRKTYRVSIDSLDHYFECIQGTCPFRFEEGKEYKITVSPQGDRHINPLAIVYTSK